MASISDVDAPGELRVDTRRLIERDSRGRFVTAGRESFLVFDPQGSTLQVVGRRGQGPGEFFFPASPLVGPGDSIHMYDHWQRRMTVFSPDLEPIRQFRSAHPAALILPDGTYLISGQQRTRQRVGYPLHRMNTSGELLNSFGTDTVQFRPDLSLLTRRIVALSNDGNVWAAAPGRYVLKKWDPYSGRRLSTIRIESPWFEESVRLPTDPRERPPPIIEGIWQDDDGLIWLLFRVADERWEPPGESRSEQPHDPDEYASTYDWMLEVVDPERQEVVASRRVSDPLNVHPQSQLLASLASWDLFAVTFDVWTVNLSEGGAK